MIGLLLAEILEEMGHTVCGIVWTEDEAVADAERLEPGLMLVDVNLHAGSGISAMSRILKSGPRPCVFMSGAAAQIDSPNAIILRKPFAQQDLAHAIERVVDLDALIRRRPLGPENLFPIH